MERHDKMELLVSDAWFAKFDGADLDMDVEAGHTIGTTADFRAFASWWSSSDRSGQAFSLFVRQLRRRQGLTVAEMAARAHIQEGELRVIERDPAYRPQGSVIRSIAEVADVPETVLARLPRLAHNENEYFQKAAFAFVERSEEAPQLTAEEEKAFDNYVTYLKSHDAEHPRDVGKADTN